MRNTSLSIGADEILNHSDTPEAMEKMTDLEERMALRLERSAEAIEHWIPLLQQQGLHIAAARLLAEAEHNREVAKR